MARSRNLNRKKVGILQRLHLPLLCVVFAGIIVVWGIILLWQQLKIGARVEVPFRKIQVIANAKHLAPEFIAKRVQANIEGGFFSLNAEKLRKALLTEPWIAEVSFRRIWPDVLQVDVREQDPVAQWVNNQLINVRGQLFTAPQSSWPANLPKFIGPENSVQDILQKYTQWQATLSSLKIKITQMHLSRNSSWSFVLDNQVTVTLGEKLVDENFQRFVVLYPKIIAPKKDQALSVDLRYPHGVAVRWRPALEPNKKE